MPPERPTNAGWCPSLTKKVSSGHQRPKSHGRVGDRFGSRAAGWLCENLA